MSTEVAGRLAPAPAASDPGAAYAQRCARVLASLRGAQASAPLGLAKRTSNLFRERHEGDKHRLDLSGFDHVLRIDREGGWADVEGLATYEQFVAALLPHGLMPAVVPQLKTITVGGAVAGVGIEATSFRAGLVHHTLLELDVLSPAGELVPCTPDNAHRDLFRGFANSYGTLGYALRVRLRAQPVKRYVEARHERFAEPAAFFARLAVACDDPAIDFVDGVVFDDRTLVLVTARFVDEAPWSSAYTYERIYWRSLLERDVDFLATEDWLWRWDTDWFWCSRRLGAQHPLLRRLYGRKHLNSRTYQRLMRWNSRWGLTRAWARLRGRHLESVIQDIDIPIANAEAFLAFLRREVGILPVWICPLRTPAGLDAPLYPLPAGALYVNFGFWDTVASPEPRPRGLCNRRIEEETIRLGGIKSLYSESYFAEGEFAACYGMDTYRRLKARYDPAARAPDLYRKCVQGA
jgi:FAD/FMN-containing dehydrogenase